jgi:hypothetical protein
MGATGLDGVATQDCNWRATEVHVCMLWEAGGAGAISASLAP